MSAVSLFRAQPVVLRADRRRPARAAVASLLMALQLSGCYHYAAVDSRTLPVGSRVAVTVTDQGRVALEGPVGPGVRRMTGVLLASTDTVVALSVNTVEYAGLPQPAQWAGERVEIQRAHVVEVRQYRLSRARTALAAVLGVAAAVALTLVSLSGLGTDDPDGPDGPDNGGQQ
jgi:hypothetical protein